MTEEMVIHPNHYNQIGRRECWDEMVDVSPWATAIFDLWNAYKYQYRAGTKSGNSREQDEAKAVNYINHAEMIHQEAEFPKDVEIVYSRMLNVLC